MACVADLDNLKNKVGKAQAERDKAQGALDQITSRLFKEFGCTSLDQAKALLKKLGKDAAAAEAKFDAELAVFNQKYGDQL